MIDYLTTNLWAIWTVIAIICLIIELGSGDFFVICFAIGAIASVLMSILGAPFWAQLLVFALCSVLSIIFVRPSLVRHVHDREERASNADALIGRKGKVIAAIEAEGYGYVKVDGDEWKAMSKDKSAIAEGETVRIISRESIIVCVERI